nr:hypothetical protein [Tanacetum cinerariifolium]
MCTLAGQHHKSGVCSHEGKNDPYLGKAARLRACSHGRNQWKLRMNLAYYGAIADSQPQTPVVHSQLYISNERVAF